MITISKHRLGLIVALFLGLWHLAWSALVGLGLAQSLIDFIFRLHFIQPPYTIAPFRLGQAAALIVVTAALGYIGGWVLAAIWNWMHPVTPLA